MRKHSSIRHLPSLTLRIGATSSSRRSVHTAYSPSYLASSAIFSSYEAPQYYIGHTIHLRYHPEDMSEIYIYDGESGKRLHTAKPVRRQDNANRKRRANINYGDMDGGGKTYV